MSQPARKFRPKKTGARTLGSPNPKEWKRLYFSTRWRVSSREFRTLNPLCVACKAKQRDEPAAVVDHIVPHRGNLGLFWSRENWQSLCLACHHEKSTHEKTLFRSEGG
jgi:5-methylcytosine-specific restriction protein A